MATGKAASEGSGNAPIDLFLPRLRGVRRNGAGWLALCPAHDDREPSLSLREGEDGRVLLKCFSGCPAEDVCRALGLQVAALFADNNAPAIPSGQHRNSETPQGCTLEDIATAKKLPPEFLASHGWETVTRKGKKGVRIPYYSPDRQLETVRFRVGLTGHRFEYRAGDHAMLYGLHRLGDFRKIGCVLLVEGESDAVTAWFHAEPCIGVPGKDQWKREWAQHLDGMRCYAWQEPGAESFTEKIGRDVPGLLVIVAPEGIKDLSEAHLLGHDIPAFLASLRKRAIPYAEIVRQRQDAETVELARRAAPVGASPDPLTLVEDALRGLGYGGDIRPALIVYLAATSRLLTMRPGSMPVHLLLLGPPSAGKSFTLGCVIALLPYEAYHVIDAGSARVLIYDDADLQHRTLVFAEADSLPSSEDNPAASAVRGLLQDHRLHYQVTVRDPESGQFTVKTIDKAGPTAMVTTSIRRLGAQLDTRLFSLEVPDDQQQMEAALLAQAHVELAGTSAPPDALPAFQAYLQALAPWDVVVPFARELAEAIAASPVAARATRDYARLLSLVKSVALLRYSHRARDGRGRIVAEVEDYATVYALIGDMYTASATGASEKVRAAVEAVGALMTRDKPATVTAVAELLQISKAAASRRLQAALKGRWLGNRETRRGMPWDLVLGEPLPQRAGLPEPSALTKGDCFAVSPLTARNGAGVVDVSPAPGEEEKEREKPGALPTECYVCKALVFTYDRQGRPVCEAHARRKS